MANEVAIRLAVKGEDATAAFDRFKQSGTAAFTAVGDVSDKTTQRLTSSLARAQRDAEAATKAVADAQAKISAITPPSPVQQRIDTSVSSVSGTSARESADAFRELLAEQDRYAAQASKLRALIDPLGAAQARYNQELAEARQLVDAGVLSASELAQRQSQLQAALDRTTASLNEQSRAYNLNADANAHMQAFLAAQAEEQRKASAAAGEFEQMVARVSERVDPSAVVLGRLTTELNEAKLAFDKGRLSAELFEQEQARIVGAVGQVYGPQQKFSDAMRHGSDEAGRYSTAQIVLQSAVRKTTDQWAAGAPIATIFAEHVSTAAEVMTLYAQEARLAGAEQEGATSKFAQFAGFLGGPWGIALTAGAAILAPMIGHLLSSGEAAKKAAEGLEEFRKRQSDIGSFIDATTGKLIEQNKTLIRNAVLTRQAAIDENNKGVKAGTAGAFAAANQAARGGVTGSLANSALALGGANALPLDPEIQTAIRVANGDAVRLDAALSVIAQRRPDLKATIQTVSDAAGQAIILARENRKLAGEIDLLNGKTTVQTKVTSGLIEKQVALATATTPLERARAAYALVTERGAAAEKAGGQALVDFRRDLTAAKVAVNAAEAAQKAATEATRGHKKELTAAAVEARKYAEEQERITANIYKMVGQAQLGLYDLQKGLNASITKGLDAAGISNVVDDRDAYVERQKAYRDTLLAQQKSDITSLAGFYQNAFNGGSGSIWSAFKAEGEKVIAQLLAKWTLSQFAGASGGLLLGGLGKLLGIASTGSKALIGSTFDPYSGVGVDLGVHNAAGTPRFSGGMTWLNENGPEIVDLPGGSRIYPASASRRMMANDNAPSGGHTIIVNANDAVLAETVRGWVSDGIQIASTQGAAGGAELARRNTARAAKYQIRR